MTVALHTDLSPANPHTAPAAKVNKFREVIKLTKPRLTFLVILSAQLCYILGADTIDWAKFTWLAIGGFLVTGASNGFNQIIEKDLDKLMTRTQKRPLPSGSLTVNEAMYFSTIAGIVGVLILALLVNVLSGILGLLALVLYTFVYTPLKSKTPFAVFVGAFPGAIPPMLGFVAATNELGLGALIVFSIQFIWQFPHFWAIAWVLDDDYRKAGFKMLPSPGGRDKSSAFQVLVYTLTLLPISMMPLLFNISGKLAAIITLICGIVFIYQAIRLYRECTVKAAQQLMFGSFFYLPLVQLALILDKV